MIELYHEWNSVHSFKVRIALAEKRLQWKERTIELLKFENLHPDYLKLNPTGVVPTLVYDGRVVIDSSVICEYLEETFPEVPLRPADAYARAKMRNWLKYHDDVAHPTLRNASFQLLYKPFLAAMPREELVRRVNLHPRPERRRKFLDGANEEIDWNVLRESAVACREIAVRIDQALGGNPWLIGEGFTLADVAMAPFAERIVNLGMEFLWQGLPQGEAWSARLLVREGVKQACTQERYRLPVPGQAVRSRLARLLTGPV